MNCNFLINKYLETLKTGFNTLETDDGCTLVVPFFKPDGEAIEITILYLSENKIRLSDDYLTSDYLFVNGINLEKSLELYEKAVAIATLNKISFVDSELFLECDIKNFGDGLSKFISAIESITYFIYKRSHREKHSFSDEVKIYLFENDVEISPSHIIKGKTSKHSIPIYLNSDKNIAISPFSTSAISAARKEIKAFSFMILDIASKEIQFLAVLDDRTMELAKPWNDSDINNMLDAHAKYVHWSRKENLLNIVKNKNFQSSHKF